MDSVRPIHAGERRPNGRIRRLQPERVGYGNSFMQLADTHAAARRAGHGSAPGLDDQPVFVGDAAHRDGVDPVDELLESILAGGLAAAGEPLQVTVGTGDEPSRLVPMNTWQLNGLRSVMTSPARSLNVRSQTHHKRTSATPDWEVQGSATDANNAAARRHHPSVGTGGKEPQPWRSSSPRRENRRPGLAAGTPRSSCQGVAALPWEGCTWTLGSGVGCQLSV